MKKRNLLILTSIAVFIALTFSSASSAPKYAIIQLTENDYEDLYPEVNCNADAVWEGIDNLAGRRVIFLYERSSETTMQLANFVCEQWYNGYPQINCNGDVVWEGYDGHDYEIFLALRITEVSVDIKPGTSLNSINLNSKGVVPVAVLTTSDFDASTVDPYTARFAGTSPQRWTTEDVDGDGDMDMLFHFITQELNLTEGSTEVTLTGNTTERRPIEGTDAADIFSKK